MRLRAIATVGVLLSGPVGGAEVVSAAPTDPAPPVRILRVDEMSGLVAGASESGCEYVIVSRGTCTHGPDPYATWSSEAERDAAVSTAAANRKVARSAALVAPVCDDGQSGERFTLIYAHRIGDPDDDRLGISAASAIARSAVINADVWLNASAQKTGGRRHFRLEHDAACEIVVRVEDVAAERFSAANPFLLWNDLQSRGYNRKDRKYLVFANVPGLCGIAEVTTDTEPGPGNQSNGFKPMFMSVGELCWDDLHGPNSDTTLHEMTHSLGGVAPSAPHGSSGFHCNDEIDVMCYDDGGLKASLRFDCPAGTHDHLLDCRDDDYFHTNPAAGYLTTHWNTASSDFLTGSGDRFVPVASYRAYDSRSTGRTVSPSTPITVQVAGVAGRAVPSGATSVVLNVAVIAPTAHAGVRIYPSGTDPPIPAQITTAGGTVSNSITVHLGQATVSGVRRSGFVTLTIDAGRASVVLDVQGYFIEGRAPSGLTAVGPARVFDTRSSAGGALSAGATRAIALGSKVPAGATAVVVNVTAIRPSTASLVTAWPHGTAAPSTGVVRAMPSSVVANMAVIPLGSSRSIDVRISSGRMHLVVDVLGYFSAASSRRFVSMRASRVVDAASDGSGMRTLGPASTQVVQIAGRLGVPAGTSAVLVNLAAGDATAPTHLTVHRSGVPTTSTLNVAPAGSASNAAIVALDADGRCLLSNAAGTVRATIDVVGYFA